MTERDRTRVVLLKITGYSCDPSGLYDTIRPIKPTGQGLSHRKSPTTFHDGLMALAQRTGLKIFTEIQPGTEVKAKQIESRRAYMHTELTKDEIEKLLDEIYEIDTIEVVEMAHFSPKKLTATSLSHSTEAE